MSSLKDIMVVDVEPLESQALRRSKEAASQQSQPSQITSSAPHSTHSPNGDSKEQPPLKRRRSNRVSKSSSQGPSSQPTLARRRSSGGTIESMESYGPQTGGNAPPSIGGSSRVSSRGSNPPESSVRYTPVTGRVSRAKKGQPVHICDLCDPPRIFTRAEHLRRHQLGHQKPAYPCTFEDCEKAFHRPDLLARHVNRHETQGEKAYRAGNSTRSRSSSISNSITPPLKVETPMRVDTSIGTPMSTAESSTPYTSASTEGAKTTTAFESIVPGFQAVNFAGERSSGQYDGSGQSSSHSGPPSGPAGTSASMGNTMANFPIAPVHGMSQGPFVDMNESGLNHMYSSQNAMFPGSSNGVPSLTLQVPEAQCPGLAFGNNNSPWYSSSDSTWSTPSSRFGGAFPRDRSNSVATIADWGTNQPIPWSPGENAIQTPRATVLETVPERFESPPYLSPHLSPRMISYPLSAVISSPAGGYSMELVGTPTLSSPYKPLAQSLSAPRTRTLRSKFTEPDGRDITMVDAQHLDRRGSGTSAVLTEKVDDYLTSYQTHLEPVYSLIHPETYAHHMSGLARNAMAALGSQFHNTPEDREYGSRIHESCMQRLALQSSEWDFQSMQAIFLTEVFARFRAKRPDIGFSYHFFGMYRKLVHDSLADSVNPFTHLNAQTINSLINTQLEKQHDAGISMDRQVAIESLWSQWIDYEVRQRLRAACFALDVHQSVCFEQSRIEPGTVDSIYLPYPCHRDLWNASTAQAWYTLISSADYLKIRLMHPEQMSVDDVFALPLATQCVSLYSIVALLPSSHQKPILSTGENPTTISLMHKITTLFPKVMVASSYLALYLTPVRKLLALTGKTWVLNHKITNHAEIDALAPSIRKWATEPSAAQATWYACHVLHILLTDPNALHLASQWWCTYTATLIIWAFGHRGTTATSSGSERASRRSSLTINGTEEAEAVNAAALTYLESMLELQPQELFSAPKRSDTNAVLDAVRWKLEADAVPGLGRPRHGMLLDAVGVLQRLRDGGKWF